MKIYSVFVRAARSFMAVLLLSGLILACLPDPLEVDKMPKVKPELVVLGAISGGYRGHFSFSLST